MNLSDFDRVCGTFHSAEMVIQWGESRVWKIGGKMFAIGSGVEPEVSYVFKATPMAFEILLAQGLATRAPYLPRGNWVRVPENAAMPNEDLCDYLSQSYDLIAATLTKTARHALGLTG